MTAKARLVAEIVAAVAEARSGDIAAARAHLERIAADPEAEVLGEATLLGLPRKLHAARLRIAKIAHDKVAVAGLQATAVPPAAALEGLFAADAALRAACVAAAGQPVPRLLHQVWIGGPPPAACAAWADWAARHGWRYRLWDEAALAEAGVTADPLWRAMCAAGDIPGAVDVARYRVLEAEGGLYLDCDWFPAQPELPPEALFPQRGLSVLAEPAPRQVAGGHLLLSNALIAAPAGHPAFGALRRALPQMMARLPRGPAWWQTGPLPFTLALRQGPVTVLDAAIVAGHLPHGAPRAEAEAMARATTGAGFLIAWKGWPGRG